MRSSSLVSVCSTAAAVLVLGCDGSGSVDPSVEVEGVPSSARAAEPGLAAPSNASAVAVTTTTINVQWQDNSTNETAFEIQRSTSGVNGTYGAGSTMAANSVAYVDVAVSAASQYCYRIRSVRVSGKKAVYSLFSNTSCATTPGLTPPDMPSTPAVPSNVSAIPSSESTITIGWQDNSTDETGFLVSRVGFNPFATVAANIVTALSYSLSQGVQYCYHVQAYHSALSTDGIYRTSYSAVSDTACAMIPIPTTPPEGSYAITVRPPSTGVLQVSPVWSGVSSAPAYSIYRSLDNASSWMQINPYRETDGTLFDAVASEQRACYYVIAFNAAGDGPPSNTACATSPNGPTDLVATVVDAQTLELTWTDNSSVEEGYQIITWISQGSPDNAGVSEWEGGVQAELPANSTTARVPSITPYPYSTIYYFVVAKKDGGRSDTSNLVNASR